VVEDAGLEFRQVYERHVSEILRYAIRCTGRREIAEEITGDAFLKMYQHRDQIDLSRAAAWLTTTVKNMSIDYWRRMEVERRAEITGTQAEDACFNDQPWEQMLQHPSLKPEHRVCLTLRYIHGMDAKEIASHTGLTENQIKNALQYGLKLLRQALAVKE
jgi:RNA polymerase sigma-70 factor (ECF subfamily)